MTPNPAWPFLKSYAGDHLRRVALPLGGIGTGTISLGGRGDLRNWEIMNMPAKGFIPRGQWEAAPSFLLAVRDANGLRGARILQGPIDEVDYEGQWGCPVPSHGFPTFAQAAFHTAYPLAQIDFTDPELPVSVTLQALNPLIPCDTAASSLPFFMLRYHLRNDGAEPLTVGVSGSIPNFIGSDTRPGAPANQQRNLNVRREFSGGAGLLFTGETAHADSLSSGTFALAALGPEADVTRRTAWADLSFGDALLDYWDDFIGDARLEAREQGNFNLPTGSVCLTRELAPGEARDFCFLLAWHFPNRFPWHLRAPRDEADRLGNFYTTRFADAWAVIEDVAPRLPDLEARTVAFVGSVVDSTIPAAIREAALFNLSTLRTTTCFQTADGNFFAWEGSNDHDGSCLGSCTHVWNYELSVPFLFGDLAKKMREIEFLHAVNDTGRMSFRVELPLPKAQQLGMAAADGQMGCLVKLYREWRLSGDDAWLARLWPFAKKALEFCWIPGGWDGDQDGVMEGCQHNTMDVEYYGPNPQMGFWYLAALHGGRSMANANGDGEFAAKCGDLYARGMEWLCQHLYNGEYFEQEIRPIASLDLIPTDLRHEFSAVQPANPISQIGAGCLVDQLVGLMIAEAAGEPDLLAREIADTTLHSIVKYNRKHPFRTHFNHFRSFVLGEEQALLMMTYPRGNRPAHPFPYYNEVMTGFEYTVAVHLLYLGHREEGVQIISDIRARYDGRKRSPFDEAECGHHYARAMVAWGGMLGWTGFRYTAESGAMRFNATEQSDTWLWSTGYAWGIVTQKRAGSAVEFTLTVRGGELALGSVDFGGAGIYRLPEKRVLLAAEVLRGTALSAR